MTNLLNLLERVFGKSKRENGNYYAFYSPFVVHHKPKLHIDCITGKWKCWITEKQHNNIFELFRQLNIDNKYYNELKLIFNLNTSKNNYISNGNEVDTFDNNIMNILNNVSDVETKHKIELPKEFKPLLSQTQRDSKISNPLYMKFYNYIINDRKLSKYDILKYNIGYCLHGDYKDNVIIPSYDADYNVNYFVGRNLYGGYKVPNSKIIHKSDVIFFESNINWNYPVNITEGVFDAITLKRNTIPLLGKSLSKTILYKLVMNGVKEVNLYLDDDVSIKAKEDIKDRLLSYNINCNIMNFIGKDTNEVGYKNVIDTQEIVEFTFDSKIKELLKI